ncbi:MAG: DUF4340 domain-containing protein [Verrucomicrobiales bacterium]|nr:DUF4340 domain-containing protein [Verrucomicrobiales bacterium]
MGNKTLTRLLIALAIIGAIAAILHLTGGGSGISTTKSSTTKKKVFADFPINEVAGVVIKDKETSLTLTKGEKFWEVKERGGYPATAEPIVSMLKEIWDLNIGQPVTIGRSQYGRLQLVAPEEATSDDEAATIVTFTDAEGTELASLWLGKVFERSENRPNPMGGGMAMSDAGRYVKPGNTNSVYLVGSTLDTIQSEPSNWVDKTFFAINLIKTIELVTSNKEDDWKLLREEPDGDLKFANPRPGEEIDPAKVSSMRAAFSNPQMEDIFSGETAKEQKTDTATFKITTFDGFTYEIATGAKDDLGNLPLTIKVDGKFEEKRKPGEEESDEEKEKADKSFADDLKKKKDKLAKEKSLEGYVFEVRSYNVDAILKKRSEILKEEEASEEGKEVAPGVKLPGLPGSFPGIPSGAPKATPKFPATPKAKAAPKAKAKAPVGKGSKAKESPKAPEN